MDCRSYLLRMALKLAPAFIIIISFISILIGIILHATSIDEVKYNDISNSEHQFEPNVIIRDKPDDLIWFLQITDLHISHDKRDRERDFRKFAKTYIDIIKPEVVIVSGDITDARRPNTTFGSGPQLDEWKAYSNAIEDSGNKDKTVWLDIRGNHDNFNVYRPADPNTLYRTYSIQGKKYARNYMHIHEKDGKNYSFIGVDEVQTPGLKIPFNFIGIVKQQDITELKEFKKKAKSTNSQYNVWFAHYPTSSLASPGENIRDIVDGPYLCGHFHTIFNMVPKMHSTQQPGFVEVELGDWKYNRLIRLAAIDHQLFSFVDVEFNRFPIALMTNPKPSEHMMPKHEPVDRIGNSTHIRVLAFSNSTLDKVMVSIDNGQWVELIHSDGPLYVLEWNPDSYQSGLHRVKIYVLDKEGKEQTYRQDFSFDRSHQDFTVLAKILIRSYIKTSTMSVYFFIVAVCTLPMLSLKLVGHRHSNNSAIKRHYRGTFMYNLYLLTYIDRLFWPLFIIPVWLSIMPNFVGYMVDQAIGACFVWGVLIDGTFLHTSITYSTCAIFLLIGHVPEVIILSNQVGQAYKTSLQSNKKANIGKIRLVVHLMVSMLQIFSGHYLWSAYGALAYFTSFHYFWCMFIYNYLWFQCTTIDATDFETFIEGDNSEEHQVLSNQRRDDKSSASDHSTC